MRITPSNPMFPPTNSLPDTHGRGGSTVVPPVAVGSLPVETARARAAEPTRFALAATNHPTMGRPPRRELRASSNERPSQSGQASSAATSSFRFDAPLPCLDSGSCVRNEPFEASLDPVNHPPMGRVQLSPEGVLTAKFDAMDSHREFTFDLRTGSITVRNANSPNAETQTAPARGERLGEEAPYRQSLSFIKRIVEAVERGSPIPGPRREYANPNPELADISAYLVAVEREVSR